MNCLDVKTNSPNLHQEKYKETVKRLCKLTLGLTMFIIYCCYRSYEHLFVIEKQSFPKSYFEKY